jgi:hypothetical protein
LRDTEELVHRAREAHEPSLLRCHYMSSSVSIDILKF